MILLIVGIPSVITLGLLCLTESPVASLIIGFFLWPTLVTGVLPDRAGDTMKGDAP